MIKYRLPVRMASILGAALIAVGASQANAQDSTLLGAGAGAGGGAGIGFALGGPVGAVVGGLVGAGVGAGAGHVIGKDEKARESRAYSGSDLTAQVQAELNAQGYNAGPADGRQGQRTTAAIRAYQGNNGMQQDGQVSVALLDHMRAKRAGQQPAAYQPAAAPAPAGAQQGMPALPQSAGQPAAQQGAQPAPQQMRAQEIDRSNCKPYTQKTMIDGKEMSTQGTACLQRDGTWRTIN